MSHRIIISSNRVGSGVARLGATDLHVHDASIEISVAYTPSHDETDKQVLSRVGKLLKLVRKMEETIVTPESSEPQE